MLTLPPLRTSLLKSAVLNCCKSREDLTDGSFLMTSLRWCLMRPGYLDKMSDKPRLLAILIFNRLPSYNSIIACLSIIIY